MKFNMNDQQPLKELADELILLEGVCHPNLVRYYGVEIHRVSCDGLWINKCLSRSFAVKIHRANLSYSLSQEYI